MTSLADLVRTAGTSLLPTSPFDAGRMITGVHVSELPDPGRYLDGGELLLTTGIPLTGRRRDADYVGRLAAQGVGALGLGLGEGWDGPPPGFVHACATNGVPLFLVPDGVPFLSVSRAYWEISGRNQRDAVMRTAHAHTRLTQTASGDDPVGGIIRQIAEAIGGWAAWVPFDDRVPGGVLHPPSLAGMLPGVATDVERTLQRSGVAAASFVAHGSAVVAHAVTDQGRGAVGALVLGAGRPLGQGDRQLALTAIAVLGLSIGSRRPGNLHSTTHWISALALEGDTAAARAVARLAAEPIADALRVVIDHDGGTVDPDSVREGRAQVRVVDDGNTHMPAHGAMSRPITLDEVPAAAARLRALWLTSSQDRFFIEQADRADAWIDALAAARPPLDDTVRTHLAGTQSIERTARTLGVHRNTVRQRISAAESLLGIGLSDPDVAAELWIALRRRTTT
ncbi:MAG: PucR family transcriptional regulator ligand-binding domain-containing protein [Microbacterium sp.]|uniref:PucR family transcriptional regulator n=1 Tax=Microbacterium gubbeenense TaxID=159896 RepID=UPI003F95F03E